tara:strand:+ start:360 stop:1619 length:1260 start_codon:yes stop_codon:yes gene_type:complete
MEIKVVSRLIIISNFLSLLVFPITDVLDINTWRLLCFSFLNIISLAYIFYNNELWELFYECLRSKVAILISIFIGWGLLSSLYALNATESILQSFTFINFYLSLLILYTMISYNKFKAITICAFIMLVVGAQMFFSYKALYEITRYSPYTFAFNFNIIGIFPNRNITSAIYLIQLPFILYVYVVTKMKILKLAAGIQGFLLLYIVLLLGSRTAYVILFVVLIVFLGMFFINKNKEIRNFIKLYLALLTLSLLFSTISLGTKNDAHVVNRISTIDFYETSTNTRLRYYKHGIKQFIFNPFIGVGLGNWKIVSVDYDKENIISYIIPYTMHNDFLEVAAELGLLGLLVYLLIYFFTLKHSWELYNRVKANPIIAIVPTCLLIWLVDSNLNFPFTRSTQLFYLAFIIALSLYFNNSQNEVNN